MNRKIFLEKLEENQKKDLKILKRKNSDYADGENAFQNFSMVEDAGLMSTEQGIAVRMSDKMQRIFNLLDKEADVDDETIEDTLSDLRNYANILQVYLQKDNEDEKYYGNRFKVTPVYEGIKQETIYLESGEKFTPVEIDGIDYHCQIEDRDQ